MYASSYCEAELFGSEGRSGIRAAGILASLKRRSSLEPEGFKDHYTNNSKGANPSYHCPKGYAAKHVYLAPDRNSSLFITLKLCAFCRGEDGEDSLPASRRCKVC